MTNAVDLLANTAGSRAKLARALAVTDQAIYIWIKQGWMPLPRAKQAMETFPSVTTLRELVRPDIRAAMDVGAQEALLD